MEQGHTVVAASNEAGRTFIRLLLYKQLPVAALTNNKKEAKLLEQIGVPDILHVRTTHTKEVSAPAFPIRRLMIFESSLPLTCQYLLLTARWSVKTIMVITSARHPEAVYKSLGASCVVYSQTGEVGFLLSRLND